MIPNQTPHVLLITLDQFRGDALGCAGHPLVKTPHLDALSQQGVRFSRHYTQSTPCAPGRAGIYTGMYQMNHRVVANGTPLDRRFDNIALLANRAGYRSVLFGYTDQSIDPRLTTSADDPRLSTYEGLLPGFSWELNLSQDHAPWLTHLAAQGYDTSAGHLALLASENERPVELGVSAFTTDRLIEWMDNNSDLTQPWFIHASYLRPHPPYSAPGSFADLYDPATVGTPIAPKNERHTLHDVLLTLPETAAPTDEADLARMRAQYFGMISAVDREIGRLETYLRKQGLWERTVIIVTSDHGEQLGDHGLKEKVGWFEESHHIPLIWRDPRHPSVHGHVIDQFTESVDLVPTLAEVMGQPIPRQCDGYPLTAFLAGDQPRTWRTAATWEFDWRYTMIPHIREGWPWDRRLETSHLVVRRSADTAYVQFGDGTALCFDLDADPTWRTEVTDPVRILTMAQQMLTWRSMHTERTHTDMLMRDGGIGFWPADVPWREET